MKIRVATESDFHHISTIINWYEESANVRGIGIAKREPEYIEQKMRNQNAVIAFYEKKLAGFCYIEIFEDEKFVVNSGLIVNPELRSLGIGKKVKLEIFKLSRKRYPNAYIFGITTNLSVMRMNTALGYEPVTFSELTNSDSFWRGCSSCKYYHILHENERKMCLCSGMFYDFKKEKRNLKRIEKDYLNKTKKINEKKTKVRFSL